MGVCLGLSWLLWHWPAGGQGIDRAHPLPSPQTSAQPGSSLVEENKKKENVCAGRYSQQVAGEESWVKGIAMEAVCSSNVSKGDAFRLSSSTPWVRNESPQSGVRNLFSFLFLRDLNSCSHFWGEVLPIYQGHICEQFKASEGIIKIIGKQNLSQ